MTTYAEHEPVAAVPAWRDARRSPGERADDLLVRMTVEEKLAQLVGCWVGADPAGGEVHPHRQPEAPEEPVTWPDVARHGLGQLARPFGTAPVDPVAAARSLALSQACTRASRRSSTSPATRAGAAPRRPSPEDPYLVAAVGTAYVRGLEGAGIVATLKHFAGCSSSRGGRNHAPVSTGPRELADVVLPPFEAALRLGRPPVVQLVGYARVPGVALRAQ